MLWIPASGGYFADAWYPSALGVAALLLVVVLAGGRALPRSREARIALLSFAALVGLNYLSVLWAASPGSALNAANELLLYLAVGWVFSLLPWTPGWLAAALGAWSLGLAAFCAIGLLQATSASNLNPFFEELRYAVPLHYPNATAALAVMGMWPALILSARREVPGWLRPGLLAVASFLAQFALLPQSRAAVLGLALTAVLVLLVAGDRLRLLTRVAVVAGGLALTAPRAVALDDAISAGRHVGPPLAHAASGILEMTLVALLVGALLTLIDGRWSFEATSTRHRWRLRRRGWLALAAAAVLVLGAGGVAAAPRIAHLANTVVKKGRTDASTGSTRLLSTTPEERFDYARVALRLFEQHPLLGVGAGNFGRQYDQLRRFQKHSQYTHDVGLRALSETGIVGFALLVAVIATLAFALVRTRRALGGLGGACAVAALAVAAYFLVHDSVDWIDEFPVLAAPTLAFSLGVVAMRSAQRGVVAEPRSRGAVGAAAAIICAAAVVALLFPYLETRYVERALATYRARPAGAYSDLRRAAGLNPLSVDPVTSEGTVALELGNFPRAGAAFERSIRQEDDWYPRLELALIDAHAGQFQSARRELSAAAKLDVDDPVIGEAREQVGDRKRMDPAHFNRILFQGAQTTLFAPQGIKK